MKIYLILYTDTTSEHNATEILNRFINQTGFVYHDVNYDKHSTGYVKVSFPLEVHTVDWEESVYKCITIAQSFGINWKIADDIIGCIDFWSDEISVSGIISCHLYCARNQ